MRREGRPALLCPGDSKYHGRSPPPRSPATPPPSSRFGIVQFLSLPASFGLYWQMRVAPHCNALHREKASSQEFAPGPLLVTQHPRPPQPRPAPPRTSWLQWDLQGPSDLQLVCIHTGLGVVVGVGLGLGMSQGWGSGATSTLSLALVLPHALSLA